MPLTSSGARELILSYGALGPAVSVGLMMLHSLLPFPSEIITLANGMAYGPFWGTLLSWVGAMLGAFLAFGIARRGGRPLVVRFLPARHRSRIDAAAERYGVGALLVLRLLPVVSFNLLNYAAGLTPMSWWTFAWTTGLGILPMTALIAVAGHELGQGELLGLWILGGLALAGGLAWFWTQRNRPRAR